MKIIIIILLIPLALTAFSGCSPLEGSKKILGISTEALETYDVRFADTFNVPHGECFAKTETFIKTEMHARIFLKDRDKKHIVALDFREAFPTCLEMTEVGFFFYREDTDKTKIEVVSLNSTLSGFVADELRKYLQKSEK
ncbi:MAG: hypothetical protein PHO00_03100 [bacterium]|nr:hypothetical protein [bacterium]